MDKQEIITKLINASPMLAAIGEEKSFTAAAERLSINQSAISHRIKALEEALGFRLFDRTTRQLQLTEVGEILCHAASDTLARWDIALDKLERSRSTNVIHLSLSSSLAMKWLIPLLPNAQTKGLSISVDVNEEAVDFHANEADAAIRFGHGPYPGLHAIKLSECWVQPVASSSYADNLSPGLSFLDDPETIFIADRRGEIDNTDFSWLSYLSKCGLTNDKLKADYQFDRADLMLQAVMGGMGVGLGKTLLVEKDIEAGYLKQIGSAVRTKSAYWLVCSASFAETKRHQKLLDWLKSEVRKTVLNKRNNNTQG